MRNINQIAITGNITGEPELKYFQSGAAALKFTVAVNDDYVGKDGTRKEEVAFIEVRCAGKFAEAISSKLKKGLSVAVSGKAKQDKWEDKTTGAKREKLYIWAEGIQAFDRGGRYEAEQTEEGQRDGFQDDIPF